MAPNFTFDRNSQRYRYKDSGKFVSEEAIRSLTRKAIAQGIDAIQQIGDLLADGKISLATWEETTARALKAIHIQSYLLGIGGLKQMSQRDYGILGNELQSQYAYLRGFSEDLRSQGMSVAQFGQRLELYVNAIRGSFERGRVEAHQRSRFLWERREKPATESCNSCLGYASLGWQPIGTLPNPTKQCECQVNCKCYKIFAKEKPTDMNKNGWIGVNELGINSFKKGDLVEWESAAGSATGKVRKVFRKGKVPGLVVDMVATSVEPICQIELYRDDAPTGILIGKGMRELMPVESDEDEDFPYPTDSQLTKINELLKSKPAIKREEVVIYSFIVADNLLTRSYSKWSARSLRQIPDMLIALQMLEDHDWDEIKKNRGFIFDAQLKRYDTAPEVAVNAAGNRQDNLSIVKKEGYLTVEADVAFPAHSPVVEQIRFGLFDKVSLGGFRYRDELCPLCNTSFYSKECSHLAPEPQWGAVPGQTISVESGTLEVAPYYERDDVFDMGECSLVTIPNLPMAKLKRG